jgi:hypothetical protein
MSCLETILPCYRCDNGPPVLTTVPQVIKLIYFSEMCLWIVTQWRSDLTRNSLRCLGTERFPWKRCIRTKPLCTVLWITFTSYRPRQHGTSGMASPCNSTAISDVTRLTSPNGSWRPSGREAYDGKLHYINCGVRETWFENWGLS